MDVLSFFELSGTDCLVTRRHVEVQRNLHSHPCGNLTTGTEIPVPWGLTGKRNFYRSWFRIIANTTTG